MKMTHVAWQLAELSNFFFFFMGLDNNNNLGYSRPGFSLFKWQLY